MSLAVNGFINDSPRVPDGILRRAQAPHRPGNGRSRSFGHRPGPEPPRPIPPPGPSRPRCSRRILLFKGSPAWWLERKRAACEKFASLPMPSRTERRVAFQQHRHPFASAASTTRHVATAIRPRVGLRRACLELGVRVHERSPVSACTPIARPVGYSSKLPTNCGRTPRTVSNDAFPPLFNRISQYVVPVYDYALMTEPLPAARVSIGWKGRQGMGTPEISSTYLRLTADDLGGYDAVYHWRNSGDSWSADRNRSKCWPSISSRPSRNSKVCDSLTVGRRDRHVRSVSGAPRMPAGGRIRPATPGWALRAASVRL